jgi:hypothetical protein
VANCKIFGTHELKNVGEVLTGFNWLIENGFICISNRSMERLENALSINKMEEMVREKEALRAFIASFGH